jgi:hypothetical protein
MRLEKSAEAIVDQTGRRAESFSPRSSLNYLDERSPFYFCSDSLIFQPPGAIDEGMQAVGLARNRPSRSL